MLCSENSSLNPLFLPLSLPDFTLSEIRKAAKDLEYSANMNLRLILSALRTTIIIDQSIRLRFRGLVQVSMTVNLLRIFLST